MLLIIVGLAFLATTLYMPHSRRQQTGMTPVRAVHPEESERKGPVVYAVRDIPEGSVISADDLEQRELLVSKIPTGAMTRSSDVVGEVVAYPIAQGTIVLSNAVKAPRPQ